MDLLTRWKERFSPRAALSTQRIADFFLVGITQLVASWEWMSPRSLSQYCHETIKCFLFLAQDYFVLPNPKNKT